MFNLWRLFENGLNLAETIRGPKTLIFRIFTLGMYCMYLTALCLLVKNLFDTLALSSMKTETLKFSFCYENQNHPSHIIHFSPLSPLNVKLEKPENAWIILFNGTPLLL